MNDVVVPFKVRVWARVGSIIGNGVVLLLLDWKMPLLF